MVDNEGRTFLHALCLFTYPFRSILCVKRPQDNNLGNIVKQLAVFKDVKNMANNTPLISLCQQWEGDISDEDSTLKESLINHLGLQLLQIGADPDYSNKQRSALYYAALYDFNYMVRLLINAGATVRPLFKLKPWLESVYNEQIQALFKNNWVGITPVMFERHLKLKHINLTNIDIQKLNDKNTFNPFIWLENFVKNNEGEKFKLYFEYINKEGDSQFKNYVYTELANMFKNRMSELLDNHVVNEKIYQRDPVLINEFLNIPSINFTKDSIKKAIDISNIQIHNVILKHERLQEVFKNDIKDLLTYILISPVKNKLSSRLEIFKLYFKKFEDLDKQSILLPLNSQNDLLSHLAAINPDSTECLDFLLKEKGFKDLVHFKNKQEWNVFDVAMIKKNIPAINLLRPFIRAKGISFNFSIFSQSFSDEMIKKMPEDVDEVDFLKKIIWMRKLPASTPAFDRNNKNTIALLKKDPLLIKTIIDGKNALHYIATLGSEDLFLEVLKLGLDKETLESVDIHGNTILHIFAREGSKNLVKMKYLNQYATLSGIKNYAHKIPLQLADIKNNDEALCNLLLAHYQINPKNTGRISENPFVKIKKNKDDFDNDFVEKLQRISKRISQSIIDRNISISDFLAQRMYQVDLDFLTLLIENNHIHLLCALLYHASDYSLMDNDQALLAVLLQYAIKVKNITAVVALVNHGAEVTSSCLNEVNKKVASKSGLFNKFVKLLKKQEEVEDSTLAKIKLFFDMQTAAWTCIEKNEVLIEAHSKLIENISPLALKNGNYPLHMLLKTIGNKEKKDNFYCLESIRWFIAHGHIPACNKKNKDGYLPIGIFLDNIEKYAMNKEEMLFIINLLLSHHVSHPILTGIDIYNPFLLEPNKQCNVDGIKQLIQLASSDKKALDNADLAFIYDIIQTGYNHIMFALLHHQNHLFTVNILTELLKKALAHKNLDMVKGLIHYGTPLDKIDVKQWKEFNAHDNVYGKMYEFIENQRLAWLDLLFIKQNISSLLFVRESYMVLRKKDDRSEIDRRIKNISMLSPYALWDGDNPLHVGITIEEAGRAEVHDDELLDYFLESHHQIAIERLNVLNQTPFLKALQGRCFYSALTILKRFELFKEQLKKSVDQSSVNIEQVFVQEIEAVKNAVVKENSRIGFQLFNELLKQAQSFHQDYVLKEAFDVAAFAMAKNLNEGVELFKELFKQTQSLELFTQVINLASVAKLKKIGVNLFKQMLMLILSSTKVSNPNIYIMKEMLLKKMLEAANAAVVKNNSIGVDFFKEMLIQVSTLQGQVSNTKEKSFIIQNIKQLLNNKSLQESIKASLQELI